MSSEENEREATASTPPDGAGDGMNLLIGWRAGREDGAGEPAPDGGCRASRRTRRGEPPPILPRRWRTSAAGQRRILALLEELTAKPERGGGRGRGGPRGGGAFDRGGDRVDERHPRGDGRPAGDGRHVDPGPGEGGTGPRRRGGGAEDPGGGVRPADRIPLRQCPDARRAPRATGRGAAEAGGAFRRTPGGEAGYRRTYYDAVDRGQRSPLPPWRWAALAEPPQGGREPGIAGGAGDRPLDGADRGKPGGERGGRNGIWPRRGPPAMCGG